MRHWLVPAAKAFILAALAAVLTVVGPKALIPTPVDAVPSATGTPEGMALVGVSPATAAGAAPTVPLAGIEAIVVSRPAEPVLRLVRRDGTWRLAEPFDAPADQELALALAERILSAWVEPLVTRAGGAFPDDAALGLTAPRLEVRLEGAGGAPLRLIRLGARNPYDGSVWARDDAHPPGRVSGMTFAGLDLDAEALRERRALPFRPELVREVDLVGPGGVRGLRVTRTLGGWRILAGTAPEPAPADPELVEAWLAELSTTRIRHHLDEVADPLPAMAHALVVRLQSGVELQLRWDTGPLAIRVAPGEPTARVDLPPQVLADLLRTPFDLSDRRMVTFARAAVVRVKVIGDERFVLFEKTSPGHWELRAPTTRAVAPGVLETLLHTLARVRAENPTAAPAAAPGSAKKVAPRGAPVAPAPAVAPGSPRGQGGEELMPASAAAPVAGPRSIELYDADARLLVRVDLLPAEAGGFLARAGTIERRVEFAEVAALGLEDLLALGK